MKKRISLSVLSLLMAITMIIGMGAVGFTASAEDTNTITVTPDTVVLGADTPITITISGGLEANKTYALRVYNSWSEGNMGKHNFTGSGVNFGAGNVGGETSFTTDANGAATITASLHISGVTAYGTYAYTIMDSANSYSTKAAAFFTVTTEQGVTASHSQIQTGVATDVTVSVTGLIPKKSYAVCVYVAASEGYTSADNGFRDNGGDWNQKLSETSASVDLATATLTKTLSLNIETAGTYFIAIMDSSNNYKTLAGAFIKVADTVITEPVEQTISATPNAIEAGVATDITLNVTGLAASTPYFVRLYTAKSGYTSDDDGFTNDGVDFGSYVYHGGITTDAMGSATAVCNVTVPTSGTYALCVMTTSSYSTVARAFVKVTSTEYLRKTVYAETEKITVLWDNIPSTVGWAAIYPKGYTDVYTYGDYIERSNTHFPSGTSSRYKAFTWPAAVGEYTVVFFVGSGYEIYKSIDIEIAHYDVTLTPDTVEIGEDKTMSLYVEGGLDPTKRYAVRIYKAYGGTTGFGNGGINWGGYIGEQKQLNPDENGSISLTLDKHISAITEAGTYAYTVHDISDSYNTLARAFFTVTEPVVYVTGDLTLDGQVNVVDLIRAKKLEAEEIDDYTNADVNGDGGFDSLDLAALKRILLGL